MWEAVGRKRATVIGTRLCTDLCIVHTYNGCIMTYKDTNEQ